MRSEAITGGMVVSPVHGRHGIGTSLAIRGAVVAMAAVREEGEDAGPAAIVASAASSGCKPAALTLVPLLARNKFDELAMPVSEHSPVRVGRRARS